MADDARLALVSVRIGSAGTTDDLFAVAEAVARARAEGRPDPREDPAWAGHSRVRLVSLGGGLWARSPFTVTFDDPAEPFTAEVDFVIGDDLEPHATALRFNARAGESLNGADTRLALVDELGRRGMSTPGVIVSGPDLPAGSAPPNGQLFMEPLAAPRHQRRRKLTPEFLTGVADVVREAKAHGLPTRQAVADHYGVVPLTARNWIKAARVRGYLADDADASASSTEESA